MLSDKFGSSLRAEIPWNFACDNVDITLAQNPHFYEELPTSRREYGDRFERHPIKHYQDKVYVLTNNSHRVLLECVKQPRVFDNAWVVQAMTNDVLIVRGP